MEPTVISATQQRYAGNSYYLCGNYFQRNGERLHRRVYKDHHGSIPDGWHVHHRDHDRANNVSSNLVALPPSDHAEHHGQYVTDAQRAARSRNAAAASAGNASITAEERSDAARRGWKRMEPTEVACTVCGVRYLASFPSRSFYCGGTCAARARRKRLGSR